MTRTNRSLGFVVVACIVTATLVAACSEPAAPAERPSTATVGSGSDVEIPTCIDCKCEGECDAESAWLCPSGTCNAAGTCACDPANAGSDCPSTGCCDAVLDLDGAPMYDTTGAPVYQCVMPACASDSACSDGEVCLAGASCGQAACGCPEGVGPDPDEPCCLTVNALGVCCTSGQVEAGLCVCSGPLMSDHGHGCQCPDNMAADDSGACVCEDPHAAFDAELGACACVDGYSFDVDPYFGTAICVPDGEPIACPDPHAVIDPVTQRCECQPGFVLGDTLETITAQCVPVSCGDEVCGPDETCELCSYDCGACDDPQPDAGVPDAGMPDAGVPDAGQPDAGAPMPDAGLPDAGVPMPYDAGLPEPVPSDAALPVPIDAWLRWPSDAAQPAPCVPASAVRCRVDHPARR